MMSPKTQATRETGGILHGNGGNGSWGDGYRGGEGRREFPFAAGRVGLLLFLTTASILFLMLVSAYMVRQGLPDWRSLPLPKILGGNTVLLLLSSGAFEWARRSSRRRELQSTRVLLLVAGVLAVLFLVGQLFAWRQLSAAGYLLSTHPASSFFYLMTAFHGLHVFGGLVAWGWTTIQTWRQGATAQTQGRTELCAFYWHFLLLIWLVILGAFWLKT